MNETMQAAVDLFTAVGVVLNGYFVFRLNQEFDRLTGRVDTVETAVNAHVNAAGLHGC